MENINHKNFEQKNKIPKDFFSKNAFHDEMIFNKMQKKTIYA